MVSGFRKEQLMMSVRILLRSKPELAVPSTRTLESSALPGYVRGARPETTRMRIHYVAIGFRAAANLIAICANVEASCVA